jgi:hypothetical protein
LVRHPELAFLRAVSFRSPLSIVDLLLNLTTSEKIERRDSGRYISTQINQACCFTQQDVAFSGRGFTQFKAGIESRTPE